MALKSLKKTKIFNEYDAKIPKFEVKDKELTQITLFWEEKRRIERKSDK